jgi:hypothetical protein
MGNGRVLQATRLVVMRRRKNALASIERISERAKPNLWYMNN